MTTLPPARPRSQPHLQKQRDGFRNPRIASHPPTHGAFIDPHALGGLNLVQAQLSKGVSELLWRHAHGFNRKVPANVWQGKICPGPLQGLL